MQGFIQAVTDLRLPEVKTQSYIEFETQSFKPKIKKLIKTVQTTWREPYLFFLSLEVINSVKRPYKNKKAT